MAIENAPTAADIEDGIAIAWRVTRYKPDPPPKKREVAYHSRQEIAAEIGLSAARVAQIERSALRKCRDWAEAHGWRLEDLLR